MHGGHGHGSLEPRSVPYHAVFLLLTLVPIVLLSKKLAVVVDYGTDALGLPVALGGVVVALLVLSPEGLAAYEAALSITFNGRSISAWAQPSPPSA